MDQVHKHPKSLLSTVDKGDDGVRTKVVITAEEGVFEQSRVLSSRFQLPLIVPSAADYTGGEILHLGRET